MEGPVEMRSFTTKNYRSKIDGTKSIPKSIIPNKSTITTITPETIIVAQNKTDENKIDENKVEILDSSPSKKRAPKERQRRSPHLPKTWRSKPNFQDEDVPRRKCLNCALCLDCERGFTFPENSGQWYWKGQVKKPRYSRQWLNRKQEGLILGKKDRKE